MANWNDANVAKVSGICSARAAVPAGQFEKLMLTPHRKHVLSLEAAIDTQWLSSAGAIER